MEDLFANINIKINDKLYLKDPDTSVIGKSVIANSILLIDEIGFENFTFKKLGQIVGSPESTIYRYFENKHKLLLYLTSWYWSWMEYRVVLGTNNITSQVDKLNKLIEILTEDIKEDNNYNHINEVILNKIIIMEASKSYCTKEVDKENKEGVFTVYKRLIQRGADIVLELNPSYKYPHMLISTVMEGAHLQRYFSEHLPKLTDVKKGNNDISVFFKQIVFNAIEKK